jgi:hypothetical protein
VSTVLLSLTQEKYALIDEEDFTKANKYKWHASKSGNAWYARRGWREKGRIWMEEFPNKKFFVRGYGSQGLHNFLMNRLWIDHINGDGLDNRKCNLRPANHSENTINTPIVTGRSHYRGVVLSTPAKRTWKAVIRINGKKTHLGSFKTEEEAAHAYDNAAKEYHREFARLNFPNE